MLSLLRSVGKTKILPDGKSFWKYVSATQRTKDTPPGPNSEAEERLDHRMAHSLKLVLEEVIGPEEGPSPVQMQNWDWNDDRTRGVYLLRAAFKPSLISKVRDLLTGEFEDFRVVLMIQDTWAADFWGGVVITKDLLVVQRNVAEAYTTAA